MKMPGVKLLQKLLPFLSLVVLFVALAIASPHFLTSTNLSSVVRQTAVINIMALGMTIIIISAGIDLSVGAILGMGGLLGAMAMQDGLPIWAGVGVGIVTGLACGLLNGLLITSLRVAPFIVTLGTLGIFRGLTLIISKGLPVHQIPPGFSFLGEGNILGVPFVLWLLLLCAVAVGLLCLPQPGANQGSRAAVVLLAWYGLRGLAGAQAQRRLTRATVIEYGIFTMIAVIALEYSRQL
jgi:ribose transport system permease protein